MVFSTAGHLLHGACALGLMLVAATQQKACDWAATRAAEKAAHAAAGRVDAPSEPLLPDPKRTNQRQKEPVTHATVLPDVAPARWGAIAPQSSARCRPGDDSGQPPDDARSARSGEADAVWVVETHAERAGRGLIAPVTDSLGSRPTTGSRSPVMTTGPPRAD